MATGMKIPTVESKALSIAIKRAMATREVKTPGLAEESNVPYGTLRKILELNTVADYEQLCRIASALRIKLSVIVADAEALATDPEVTADFEGESQRETLIDRAVMDPESFGVAALHDENKSRENQGGEGR
jgi:hypothetical protein